MKVLLVGDKESAYVWDHFDRKNFAGVECVLSCGDLSAHYLEFIVTMLSVPLYYVPGNHDKTYDKNPPGGCTCVDGKLTDIGGLSVLGFGGCRAANRDIHQYTEGDMRRRVRKTLPSVRRRGFDILLTHAPSFGLGDGKDQFHQGFECFRELLETYKPRYQIYGHQHKAYGFTPPPEGFGDTRLINACGHRIIDL
ncbi:serine/threonine protein phosphatase [Clostridia bacterium]|nr:serine/threonine protein phosphatase [Clostridia bacterium]